MIKYGLLCAVFLLGGCMTISSKPYQQPQSGDMAQITFSTSTNRLLATLQPRVSEMSCKEVDGVDYSPSKLNKNTFRRTQNTAQKNVVVNIPAGKDVYVSWVAEGGRGLITSSGANSRVLGHLDLVIGGKFIPEKNAQYVYQFDFEKGSYPSSFYKISSNGDKTPIPLARCKSYPFSP